MCLTEQQSCYNFKPTLVENLFWDKMFEHIFLKIKKKVSLIITSSWRLALYSKFKECQKNPTSNNLRAA